MNICYECQIPNQKEKFWKGQGRVEGDEKDREKAERGRGGGEEAVRAELLFPLGTKAA